jgi:hypothetical protein
MMDEVDHGNNAAVKQTPKKRALPDQDMSSDVEDGTPSKVMKTEGKDED